MFRKLVLTLILVIALLTTSGNSQVIQTSSSAGLWTPITFAAGNYTASAGAWTVIAGNQVYLKYTLTGKTLTYAFDIQNTTVTVGGTLRLALPAGMTVATGTSVFTAIRVRDNGGAVTFGMANAISTNGFVTLFALPTGAGFAASTTNTDVQGEITFEVQ